MTKHTPGKWGTAAKHAPAYDFDGCKYSVVYSERSVYPDEGTATRALVAWHDDVPGAKETSEADARLIAASPDLLEALDALYVETAKSGWHNAEPTIRGRKARAALLNAARDAIRKAKGE